MIRKNPRPFVKWAGGKRQLVEQLFDSSPKSFNNYHEPFLGGGALFFRFWAEDLIKKAFLNDSNSELINAYSIIKERPSELIEELKSPLLKNTKEAFYKIRESEPMEKVERAAKFIYLNRTGFNGLYRVNSKGKFNVPFGKYNNPKILDEENISLVSEALQKASITNEDFSIVLVNARENDFVYFDPPYHPISKTSSFTSYTKNDFIEKDQIRLNQVYSNLDSRGVKVMLSNSNSSFITELYSNYSTQEVMARRAINCKAEKRGPVSEIIAVNYPG